MAHLNEAIAQSVIEQDQNSFRFERFCNALISDAYEGGNPILPTSSSWDLGRDGRAHGAHGSLFSCCSLRDDVDKKARDDIARLVQYSGPIERIYFCTSQRLSEKGVETIKRDLVALLPS